MAPRESESNWNRQFSETTKESMRSRAEGKQAQRLQPATADEKLGKTFSGFLRYDDEDKVWFTVECC